MQQIPLPTSEILQNMLQFQRSSKHRKFWKDGRTNQKACCRYCGREALLMHTNWKNTPWMDRRISMEFFNWTCHWSICCQHARTLNRKNLYFKPWVIHAMGILIDRTPKCHCELAGEGIEYSWGCLKNFYHHLPVTEKRTKKNFQGLVRRSLSHELLTTERIRKFSKQASQYICAYHSMWQQQQPQQNATMNSDMSVNSETSSGSLANIKKLVKQFKTHRCALDFDYKFIKIESDNT